MIGEFLRKFKFSYVLYNLFKKDELSHNLAHYKKFGINKKYYSSVSSEDFKHLESPKNIYDEKDSATELPKNDFFNSLPDQQQEELLPWSKNGYAILKKFYSDDEVDAFNAEVDRLIGNKEANWKYRNKIMFAIHDSDLLNEIATGNRLTSILNLLMGKEVEIFQSINFITGSQQKTHSDSVHMTTFPYGNIIAVWIAFQDVTIDDGPLHYYPGSHKMPYIMNGDYDNVGNKFMIGSKKYEDYEKKMESIVKQNNYKKEVFQARKGDVLIWHANLLHGGEEVNNKEGTRKSMVLHYYTNDAICFHEVSQRPTLKVR